MLFSDSNSPFFCTSVYKRQQAVSFFTYHFLALVFLLCILSKLPIPSHALFLIHVKRSKLCIKRHPATFASTFLLHLVVYTYIVYQATFIPASSSASLDHSMLKSAAQVANKPLPAQTSMRHCPFCIHAEILNRKEDKYSCDCCYHVKVVPTEYQVIVRVIVIVMY